MAISTMKPFAFYGIFVYFFLLGTTFCSSNEGIDAILERNFAQSKGRFVILVRKKDFMLDIIDRKKQIVAQYSIGYGGNPDKKPKVCENDNRTPEGEYKIVAILSMDADKKTASYRKLAALNRIYFRAKNGHSKFGRPKDDLGDNVYGPRFFSLNYPNANDRKRYQKQIKDGIIKPINGKIPGIGFGIAIHGNNDEASIGHLCTNGCVRMYNSDIVELDQYVEIGTPVIITSQ